jgi:hypothetical protein
MAFIAFVDDTRQRTLASVGVEPLDTPRERSLGHHVLGRTEPLIVADARKDPRAAAIRS